MASRGLNTEANTANTAANNTENEEQRIEEKAINCVKNGKNFVLNGGAGSGKTYSLISIINSLIANNSNIKIVCITYTNNAADEILSRLNSKNVIVSTIHSFMWSLIKRYQYEIKTVLVELIKNDTHLFASPKNTDPNDIIYDYFKNLYVDYDSYYSMNTNNKTVKISHDHVLAIAEKIFEKYSKISDILKDTADCIFVDEYQDTDPLVAKILLQHLKQSKKKNVIGFFGDPMQAIYENSVGDLDVEKYNLTVIKKYQNRRNPSSVITLANKFRSDGIKQVPSNDINAPNMENGSAIKGSIKFFYGKEQFNSNIFTKICDSKYCKSFDKNNAKQLFLTNRIGSSMAGFSELYDLYNKDEIFKIIKTVKEKIKDINTDTDMYDDSSFASLIKKFSITVNLNDHENYSYKSAYNLLKNEKWKNIRNKYFIDKNSLNAYKLDYSDGKYAHNATRDKILQRLDELEYVIELYENDKVNDFLKVTNFAINCEKDKLNLKGIMDNISKCKDDTTIGEILNLAEEKGLLKKDMNFENYKVHNGFYLWSRIKEIEFKQYKNSVEYFSRHSPFCTQHSVKGNEYDDVLVVLNSYNWRMYDFETLFKNSDKEKIQERTRKLFYVCITRARRNLIVYMRIADTHTNYTHNADSEIVKKAEKYFGKDNVISIDSI